MSEDQIQRCLSADPRVLSVAIEPGPMETLVARVVPAPRWRQDARAAATAALSTRMLRQWRMVFDRTYRLDQDALSPTPRAPGFSGWVSSFTGEPMSQASMAAWLDDTVAQLRAVPHRSVLDIGCGVGLITAALGPACAAYEGIDLSEQAIAALGAWCATRPELGHVQLARRAAHELDGPPGTIDLVVLNSVVQYFPDVDYLKQVLRAAASRLAPGGHIFLGDLRALGLLGVHAAAVAAARAPAGATAGEVRDRLQAGLDLARELALDPGFFADLATDLPGLTDCRFSLKPATADPELAGYRFDAMLQFNGDAAGAAPPAVEWDTACGDIAGFTGRIRDTGGALAVRAIPNARIAREVALARRLTGAPADLPVGTPPEPPCGQHPEVLAATAAALGSVPEMRFTPGSAEGRFDVLLRPLGAPPVAWPASAAGVPLASDPLGADLAANLRHELQRAVDSVLGTPGRVRVLLY